MEIASTELGRAVLGGVKESDQTEAETKREGR
jgi:hypothetical protein